MPKIKLLIAEDETVVRYALAQVLGAEEDIEVVGEAADGEEAVSLARQRRPDVALMDLDMPRLDGIAATREIKEELPECAVVMLTIHSDGDKVFDAIKAGASGYMLKDSPPEQTLAAIRAAAGGEGFLHPGLVGKVMDEFARISGLRAAAKGVFEELTRRELEVLEHLGKGLTNREIAEELHISPKTVKNHVSNILLKLHVNDRTQAAVLATRHGLTDSE